MHRFLYRCASIGLFGACSILSAATFTFNTDPFAGSTALITPGRQVVGGEASISFSIANDVFALDPTVFAAGNSVNFINDLAPNLPASGVNIIVLQSFDDDANPATPFGAGNAANLIANRITTPGAGFFVYFNQGLDLPRLVYSTDLNDNTADLKILFRMTNLNGQPSRDAVPTFSAANFALISTVPEPSTLLTTMSMAGIGAFCYLRRKRASA
jgi:hypothetical protein